MSSVIFQLYVLYFLMWSTHSLFAQQPCGACTKTCGAYEERRFCGSSCPMTCNTLNTNVCCDLRCVSGCFCRDGYILLSDVGPKRCVPLNDCPQPGILEFANQTITVFESMKIVMIVILRLNGTAGIVTVQWRTVEGTARQYVDFIPANGNLVFPEGVTSQTITIEIVDDTVREPDKIFTVVLSDPTNKAEINPRRLEGITVIIKDDDMRPGYIEVELTTLTVVENIGTVNVALVRLDGTDGQIRMKYRTIPGTAAERIDYLPTVGDVVFDEGESRKVISLVIIDDDVREPMENIRFQLYDPSAGEDVVNYRSPAKRLETTIIIMDNDMKPGYIEVESTTIEVYENIGTVNVTLIRLEGTEGLIRIKYRTIDGTAQETIDYMPTAGEVIFNDGETRKIISLTIIDDDKREPIENIRLQLFDPSAADDVLNFRSLASRLETTIIIKDNDMKPGSIELPNPVLTFPESVGTITINVVRVEGTDGEVRCRYRTVEATASATSDYVLNSGELIFREGESVKTVVINILDDNVREGMESFRFELYDITAAPDVLNFRGMSSRTATIITIVDDDMTPGYLELEQVNVTVRENVDKIQVSIVRLGGTDGILQLKYKTTDVTATMTSDYEPVTGDLVFKDGESKKFISIAILNDNVRESIETFQLQIYDISPGFGTINFRSLGTRLTALITILDDDERPGYVEMETATITAVENAGTVTVPLVRLEGSDGVLRVPYKIIDVSAVAGSDYKAPMDEIIFNDGETRKVITIEIIDDQLREIAETFQIQLLDLDSQLGQFNFRRLGARRSTVVSIIDNDAKLGLVQFERKSFTIREDVGVVEIPVVRIDGTDGSLLVKYKAVVGSAISLVDFIVADGDLLFKEGVDRMTIKIRITDDRIKEADETFSLIIYEPDDIQGRRTGEITSILVTIIDNDNHPGIFEFQKIRISVPENSRTLSIVVIRKGGSDGLVTLQIRTRSGTATEGVDYNSPPLTIDFPDGIIEQRVHIQIIDDDVKENDENFLIGIFNPTNGGSLGEFNLLTVVIIDDDEDITTTFS